MLNRYVGLPYRFGGRTLDGLDCLGLARLFYKEQFGIEIPEYLYGNEFKAEDCAKTIEGGSFDGNWRRVLDPSFGDLLVYRVLGQPTHVGLEVGDRLMLHSFQGRNSCLEPQDAWAHRLTGRFRWHTM